MTRLRGAGAMVASGAIRGGSSTVASLESMAARWCVLVLGLLLTSSTVSAYGQDYGAGERPLGG